jgi:hypothetical protein
VRIDLISPCVRSSSTLAAGAAPTGIALPSGYGEIDELLACARPS